MLKLVALSIFLYGFLSLEAKVLTKCDLALILDDNKVSRSYISNWVCLAKAESNMDSSLIFRYPTGNTGYGIFQIKDMKWCRPGYKGGLCSSKCEDLASDNLAESIKCGLKIYNSEGFQNWPGWVSKCKNKPLPNIRECF